MKSQNVLITKSIATLNDDGLWEVTGDMVAGHRESEGESWLTRTISVKSYARKVEDAVETVQKSLNAKFKALEFDLFNLSEEEDGIYIRNPIEDNPIAG